MAKIEWLNTLIDIILPLNNTRSQQIADEGGASNAIVAKVRKKQAGVI